MEKKLEVKPLKGIGAAMFGMNPSEIMNIFGEKLVWEQWMGGNLNDSLFYQGIIFGFDQCNSKGPLQSSCLVEVYISGREEVFLYEKFMNDWTKQDLVSYFSKHDIEFMLEDDDYCSLPSLCLDMTFNEYGALSLLSFWKPKNSA